MTITIILSIFFILLLGLSILNIKRIINTEKEFRALIYDSVAIQFLLSTSMLLLTILSIFILFFYSWKLFFILILINLIIQKNIAVPYIEKILDIIVNKIVKKLIIKK